MTQQRLNYLKKELEAENISLSELIEIQEEFALIPDSWLSDERENALASDMLNEIEQYQTHLNV